MKKDHGDVQGLVSRDLSGKKAAIVLVAMLTVLLMSGNLMAKTIYINYGTGDDSTGDGSSGAPYKTFNKGYVEAVSNDTLDLTGTFDWTNADETGDTADGYVIGKNLTIQGQGAASTTVQAAGNAEAAASRVFAIDSGVTVTFQNMTIQYGNAMGNPARGGGIYNQGQLTLKTVTVAECWAMADRRRDAYGGGIWSSGTLMLTENTTISYNSAFGGESFENEDGGHAYGGGIYSNGGATLIDSTITENSATGGYEVVNLGTAGSAYGGGIYNEVGQTLTVTRGTISSNVASGGRTEIDLAYGGHSYGGGICNYGTAELTQSTITANEANGGYTWGSLAEDGGHAYGGGLSNNGTTSLTRSTLSGNEANGGYTTVNTEDGGHAYGGGIYNHDSRSLTVSKSTISGNTAQGGDVTLGYGGSGQGGGVSQAASGTLTFTNTTFSGNKALQGDIDLSGSKGTGNGGGLWGSTGMSLTNCTVASNSADDNGGGIYMVGTVNLKNTILAGNAASSGPDCNGTPTSQDYNLLGNNSGCPMADAGHDQIGTSGSPIDPLLGTLGDYGGDTQTMLLCISTDPRGSGACSGVATGDSPALDQIPTGSGQCGGSDPYDVDQRSVDRPYSSDCDMGAYERTDSTLVDLASFTAKGFQDRVHLFWETASELDNAGFHLWRSRTKDGAYNRITQTLIPAEGGAASGTSYTHDDRDVTPPQVWYYKLEDMDNSGAGTFHGPVLGVVGDAAVKEVNGSRTIGGGDTAPGIGEVKIEGTGPHTVTTGRYEANPAGGPTFTPTGDYWFLNVTEIAGLNRVTIRFCPAEADNTVYYWNGTRWVSCSRQDTENGCLQVTLTHSTNPPMSHLNQLLFALGRADTAIPTVTEWGMILLCMVLVTTGILVLGRRGKPEDRFFTRHV